MISISAVLRSLYIGFENFERVLTEYDQATNDLLNFWHNTWNIPKIILNNRVFSKICFAYALAPEIMVRLCLPWAASGSYDKKRGKNVEVLPWHILKTYLQFWDYPFQQ